MIKLFFNDLDGIKLDYDLKNAYQGLKIKIANKKLFDKTQYNEKNYPILFAVTDFADYYNKFVSIRDLQ